LVIILSAVLETLVQTLNLEGELLLDEVEGGGSSVGERSEESCLFGLRPVKIRFVDNASQETSHLLEVQERTLEVGPIGLRVLLFVVLIGQVVKLLSELNFPYAVIHSVVLSQ
jgi:hypothetical protein